MHLEGLFIRMTNFGTRKLQLGKTWLNNLYKMLTYLILPIILGGHQGPIPHYTVFLMYILALLKEMLEHVHH